MKLFLRFMLVGGTGFVVDAALLWLILYATGIGPLPARLVSSSCSMLVTWMLNRNFAFGPSDRKLLHEGAVYGGVTMIASMVNFTTYAIVLFVWPHTAPLLAMLIGSVVATAFSFTGYSRVVFR
ncbi:MAG: GtrA family protein [Methylobacterium mesophilicum]|nr:GtrA family protein [Methylobacterium mesophilicum]